MKKIYYLLVLLPVAFTACQKQPYVQPNPLTKTATLTFTLTQADYQLLPSTAYPSMTDNFNSAADANTYIPMILTAKESPLLNDQSTATVTYAIAPPSVKVADSLYSDIHYTVTSADYFAVTGNHYGDFSSSDVLNFLAYKYPAAVANQLVVLSYVLYNGTDTNVVNSFLYINGAWMQIYQISPAQYAIVGDGKYDNFSSAEISKLPGYFNAFLKADITIMDTIKTNDVEYVSYQIYTGATYQKGLALTYDGNNFGAISTQGTGSFLKTKGAWAAVIPSPTITHKLTATDIQLIVNSTIGSSSERSNLNQYGDFSNWAAADLDSAFILVLTTDYPSPQTGTNYDVVYLNYTGGSDVSTTIVFQWNGTAWAAK
jgi:hypothetical protein